MTTRLIDVYTPWGKKVDTYEASKLTPLIDRVWEDYKKMGYSQYVVVREKQMSNGEWIIVVMTPASNGRGNRVIEFHIERE